MINYTDFLKVGEIAGPKYKYGKTRIFSELKYDFCMF